MDITQVSIIHHIALVLLLLWAATSLLGWAHPALFFLSLLYLYKINERYTLKLRRKLQFEERKSANQKRLLSDSESVRWLNHAVERIWPICMEQIASQQFLMPVIPWFLEKFKPWTAKDAAVQHLYLGRRPPMFTEIRVLGESADDDHLVLELGMNFLSGDDLSIILAVQPRIGLGIWANMHITGMHVEGKVLVGVKFLRRWPFIGRLRVSFAEPPYFQMTVKPIFNHGVDVTELPGIAGWLDNMLAVAFEQTLVEPNMLVVDVDKFATSPKDGWFTVDEKAPIAHAKVEVIEAADLKPSDLNGLADPYVKGHLGSYKFRTKIQKKTLSPKWLEEFKIPITSWEAPNLLVLELRDKDHLFDDLLGDCAININELRGGLRHDKWVPLLNIKTGRVHLAVTIQEGEDDKGKEQKNELASELQNGGDDADADGESKIKDTTSPRTNRVRGEDIDDEFEPIDIKGQEKTGIWVHHPGKEVSQSWEPRKGRARRPDTTLQSNEGSDSPWSADSGSHLSEGNDDDSKKVRRLSTIKRGMNKIGSIFHSNSKKESSRQDEGEQLGLPTPRANLRSVGEAGTTVRVIFDDTCGVSNGEQEPNDDTSSPEKEGTDSTKRGRVKAISKNIISKPAHALKSVLSRKGSFSLNEEQSGTEGSEVSQPKEPSADVKPSTKDKEEGC